MSFNKIEITDEMLREIANMHAKAELYLNKERAKTIAVNFQVGAAKVNAIFAALNAINFGAGKMKTPRKHADLIKQWADDDSLVVERRQEGGWFKSDFPFADKEGEYRIKPTKPSIDWSTHIFNYLAMDSNGDNFLFTHEPFANEVGGLWGYSQGMVVPANVITSFKPGTCDWKESLVQRPESE